MSAILAATTTTTWDSPTIEYSALAPILIVLGAAVISVLLEAFLPRERRFVVQTVLAGVGLVVALVGTILVARDLDVVGGGVARGGIDAENARDGLREDLRDNAHPFDFPAIALDGGLPVGLDL